VSGRTRIKICGLRTERDVLAAVESGADAVGFVFAQASPRYIEPEAAADLVCLLPPFVEAVGLFANEKAMDVCELASEACVGFVQLHGQEDLKCVARVREEFAVIKAVQFDDEAMRQWTKTDDIDMLLVDGSDGGQGTAFDWGALAAQRHSIQAPLMLAGGLTPDNVAEAIRGIRPYAVDVSSGVERERGVKDPELIRRFCEAVRVADQPSND